MELILREKWHDKESEIDNRIYTIGKTTLVHSRNPSTKDANFSVLFMAGSAFEEIEGVPRGTAHFLEHMLMNPNKKLKSIRAISRFEDGTRDRPEIFMNASTNRNYMFFYGAGNEEGIDRMIERICTALDFPIEKFEKAIEREREIIVKERTRLPKKDKDSWTNYLNFIVPDLESPFANSIIGEVEEINSITTYDLKKFMDARFTQENMVISIQNNSELTPKNLRGIKKILEIVKSGEVKTYGMTKSKNRLEFKHFYQEDEEGIFTSFNYLMHRTNVVDYKEHVLSYLSSRLVNKLGYEKLREKMGLLYSIEDFSTFLTPSTSTEGFKFSTSLESYEKSLNAIFTLINKDLLEFLYSRYGKEWFESVISSYLFPRTSNFDPNYAERIGLTLLIDREIFKYEKAQQLAKKVTIDQLKEFIKKSYVEQMPHIWIVSSYDEEEIYPKVEKVLHKLKYL